MSESLVVSSDVEEVVTEVVSSRVEERLSPKHLHSLHKTVTNVTGITTTKGGGSNTGGGTSGHRRNTGRCLMIKINYYIRGRIVHME